MLSSTQLFSSLTNFATYIFLNLEFSALSAISLRPAENLVMSTNLGKGVTLPLSSWNRYVAIPQCGWVVNVTLFWPRMMEANLEMGATTGTGYQSSLVAKPVCFSTLSTRSGRVNLPVSSSSWVILPEKEMGWKLTPLMTSEFSKANLMMSPILSSFIPIPTTGTSTMDGGLIPSSLSFLQFSMTPILMCIIFLPLLLR